MRDDLPIGECNPHFEQVSMGPEQTAVQAICRWSGQQSEEVRDYALRECGRFGLPVNFTIAQAKENLKKERVATAAINYLNAIAFP